MVASLRIGINARTDPTTQIMNTDTHIIEEMAEILEQPGSSPDNRKKQLQTGS
jgi:hypothetical protein